MRRDDLDLYCTPFQIRINAVLFENVRPGTLLPLAKKSFRHALAGLVVFHRYIFPHPSVRPHSVPRLRGLVSMQVSIRSAARNKHFLTGREIGAVGSVVRNLTTFAPLLVTDAVGILGPSDICLLKLKMNVAGKGFVTDVDVKKAATSGLNTHNINFFLCRVRSRGAVVVQMLKSEC